MAKFGSGEAVALMKIGFPIWYGYGDRIRGIILEAAEAGFDYIEVSLDYPWPLAGDWRLEEVVGEILDRGLSAAFHAPWRDIRLASPIGAVRRASVRALEKFMSRVSKYPCDYAVVHVSSDQAVDRIPRLREECVASAVKSIREILSSKTMSSIRIVCENVREDLEMFKRIISEAGVEVCLDVSHAICVAARSSRRNGLEEEARAWIRGLGSMIRVLHISGVRFEGNWVRDHLTITRDDRYLKLVKEELEGLAVENLLLEVFEDPGGGEARPIQLRGVVECLRKG